MNAFVASSVEKTPAVPHNFSILIVEDDDDARENMQDILSLDGYQILSVSHCLPAIAAIEERAFDAVIVDWRLPDGSGGDLIPVIKRELPETPVIVVTGVRDFDTPVEALRNGAYDFLPKPIEPDFLRAVLARLVERKQYLIEIEEAQQKLVAAERLAAIGQMVAGLAHESRNAFQRSHACLDELTLDLVDKPDSLKLVQKIQKALDDLNRLLEEVREYSAPIILERRDCDVVELVQATWKQIVETKAHGLLPEINFQRSDDFPKACSLDENRIQQVFRNLLENAIFACGEPGKIDVKCEKGRSPQQFRVTIADNGGGVEEANREQIFTPFFTTKTKGTGLGLAICRRIVAAHLGRLFVEATESGGAKFVLELPISSRHARN